ncbi:MAG: serine protease [Ignavibacteria bacterium]
MKNVFIVFLLFVVRLNLSAQCFNSKIDFENYFEQNISNLDLLEGIWSITVTLNYYHNNKFVSSEETSQASEWAIIRDGSKFRACEINSLNSDGSIIEFTQTVNPYIYLYKKTYLSDVTTANAVFTSIGLLEYSAKVEPLELNMIMKNKYMFGYKIYKDVKWIKLFPTIDNYKFNKQSSGSGFAISNDGLIITCNHVIENADNLKVRGIDNNFSKTFNAKLIVTDKNNDIAIIQIDDPDFTSIDKIPYNLSDKSIDVGSSVFALGYPLLSTMGDEIKLTDGLISANSGYKGDITAYQISVPVQPGNSGGPLFDETGNIVGIINAKNSQAENASYAVKISYLKNLLESLSLKTDFAVTNTLSSKTLSEKVKLVKNFTYIIECN